MKIRGEALELALRIVLSCPCPVTNDEERQVFEYLRGLTPDEVADYAPVLAIFAATDTPFHGLADFTGWMAPAGAEATIEREHVLRCNASSYHWQLAAGVAAVALAPRLLDLALAALAHGDPGHAGDGGRRRGAGGVPLRGRRGDVRPRLPAARVRSGRLAGVGAPSRRRR